jgi:hypothetical protein
MPLATNAAVGEALAKEIIFLIIPNKLRNFCWQKHYCYGKTSSSRAFKSATDKIIFCPREIIFLLSKLPNSLKKLRNKNYNRDRGVGVSHGLWPWKYLREGAAKN